MVSSVPRLHQGDPLVAPLGTQPLGHPGVVLWAVLQVGKRGGCGAGAEEAEGPCLSSCSAVASPSESVLPRWSFLKATKVPESLNMTFEGK